MRHEFQNDIFRLPEYTLGVRVPPINRGIFKRLGWDAQNSKHVGSHPGD